MQNRREHLMQLTIEQLNQELKDEGFFEYELKPFNDTTWSFYRDKPFNVDTINDLIIKLGSSKYFYINSLQQIILLTEEKSKEFLVEKILMIIG